LGKDEKEKKKESILIDRDERRVIQVGNIEAEKKDSQSDFVIKNLVVDSYQQTDSRMKPTNEERRRKKED